MPLLNRLARLVCAAAIALPLSSAPQGASAATSAAATSAPPLPPSTGATAKQTIIRHGSFSYAISPQPSWVTQAPLPGSAPSERAPMHYRLIDDQLRIEARSATRYRRVVRVVDEPAGLGPASQIEIEFDPSFEALALHRIEIVRGGRRIDKLDRKRIELLQREKQLEQRIYDGRVTASIVLDDVRVGDEIDAAFSVEGLNPVFEGRFVHQEWLATDRGPAARVQTRLLAPESRAIRHRIDNPKVQVRSTVAAGLRETVFVRDDVPQFRPEPGTPAWATAGEWVQFSEFADWSEVAAWGERLFSAASGGAATAAKADEIRAAGATVADRARDALDFVQREVRYFGIEIGPGTHRPNPADAVLQQRFGDCKDKVTLLVGLLSRLGIAARPVLVSTALRGHAGDFLPSPLMFDHVIAAVELDGRTLFLDPTRSYQSGPLALRQSTLFSRGLVLNAGSRELLALPEPFETEWMRVEDRIIVSRFADPPTLESRVVYRHEMGAYVRDAVAAQGVTMIADGFTQAYMKTYPKLRRLGAPELQAVADDDAVALVQRFTLHEFWRFPEQRQLVGDLVLWAGIDALIPPKSEARRQPFVFAFPGRYAHKLTVQLPEAVFTQDAAQRSDDGDAHFGLTIRSESTRDRVEYTSETRILADSVAPERWSAYLGSLNKAWPKLAVNLVVGALSLADADRALASMRRLEEEMKSGRVKVLTRTQADAQFALVALDAKIDGGRLEPRLLAQALTARGIARDHVGRSEDARRDFEAALALDPEAIEALNAAAENARGRGDDEAAIRYASEVLKRQPRDADALQTRGVSRYFQGRYAQARADLEAALATGSTARRGYGLIWLALTTRREGRPARAIADSYPRANWPSEWPRPILDHLVDGGDADAAMRAAKAGKDAREQQTEAWYYIGERLAAEGDEPQARDAWRRVLDLGVVEFVEYAAARRRLASGP